MKLLIITQKVDKNDSVLGFFHGWIVEFAKHCEKLIVICLYKGEYDLPENVKVLSLEKENGRNRLKYIFKFYKYIWKYRKDYDNIFVHMNQIYVLMGGFFWKIYGKKIGLWYTHKRVNILLKIAEKISDIIFTASNSSFRLFSKKLKVMGHGIDTNIFCPDSYNLDKNIFEIISIGRISPVKKYEQLIDAIELLLLEDIKLEKGFTVKIIGEPITDNDKIYFDLIRKNIKYKKLDNVIHFIGPVSNYEIVNYLRNSKLFLHMSQTGSLDKAILEAMACGVLVISNNDSVKNDLLSNYHNLFCYENVEDLTTKIKNIINMDEDLYKKYREKLRNIVVEKHNLKVLINNIINKININD